MLNGLRYSFSPLIATAIYWFPDMLRENEAKTSIYFAENSQCSVCSSLEKKKKERKELKNTTGELYIWLLVPDDVKTGADPEPATQGVPQRACFPFLCLRDIFLPRGTSGSRLTGPGIAAHAGRGAEVSSHPNRGRWGMKPRPPASVFNCLQIYFPYSLQSRRGASPLLR